MKKDNNFFEKSKLLKSSKNIMKQVSIVKKKKKQESDRIFNKISIREKRDNYYHICKTKKGILKRPLKIQSSE